MNIELLELFVLLSKHQSFSKVAELTYSSQSSVSKKIAKLESLADIRLFNRDPNGVLLTEAGKLVLPYAEEIIRLHNEALMQLDKFQTRSANQLKLGATTLYGQYLMPQLIETLQREYPQLQVLLQVGRSREMMNKLMHHDIDILIASSYMSYDSKLFSAYRMQRDPLVLVVPTDHPFAQRQSVSIRELEDEPFIIKEREALLYRHILSELQQIEPDFEFSRLIEINNQNNIINSVSYGYGISIVSQLALEASHSEQVVTVELEECQLYREIICLIAHNRSQLERAFIRFIQQYYAD